MAITICGVLAFGLVLTSDLDFLAGTFAFGATLAFAIAHASVIRLRFREATARRPYRMPFSIKVGSGSLPLPAVLGFVMAVAAWVSVVILHEGARYAGGAWLLGGLLLYVIYRRGQDKPLRKRFTIPATALQERGAEIEYGSILVPVFGSPLDDDIVGTAGRLAAEEAAEGEGGTVIEAIYVLEIPMSLPIDARVPDEQIDGREARAAPREGGGRGVRGRRGGAGDCARPLDRRGHRGGGAAARGRGDRARRGGADAHARRRAARRPRRPARPLRRRDDSLRGREGAVPRDPHRAARGRAADARGRQP